MHAGCKDGTVANDHDIDKRSSLHIGPEVANNVSLDRVFAHIVLGSPKAGKDSVTRLNSTSNLRRSLPHDLGEVGWLRVVGVVFRNFIGPVLDSLCDAVRAGASSKILAQGTKGSARVFVQALVGPLLCFLSGSIAPCNSHGAVLRTDRVVRIQVRLFIGIRCSAAIAARAAAAAAAVAAVGVGIAIAI
jgi:hypothetical protein